MTSFLTTREQGQYDIFCQLARSSETDALKDWLAARSGERHEGALMGAMTSFVRRYLRSRSDYHVKRSYARPAWHGSHPRQTRSPRAHQED